MTLAAPWIVVGAALLCGVELWGQAVDWSFGAQAPRGAPASPTWPFGPPKSIAKFQGLVTRSDGQTLSLQLADQRVIRFQLNEKTQYGAEEARRSLNSFQTADLVAVEAEVDGHGYLVARAMRFVRPGSGEERIEVAKSPELAQRWRGNVIGALNMDAANDDRRLALVAKPEMNVSGERAGGTALEFLPSGSVERAPLDPVARIRRAVTEAFDRLPDFRAKQITSLFGSSSRPIKWVPDGVISLEIAYEEDQETYSDIRLDGARPDKAPQTVDADYIRSLNKAWSTGDFKTISHCVFDELQDGEFRKVRTEPDSRGDDLDVYEFQGVHPSTCIGILYRSQVTYPGYKGLLKARAKTGEVVHVELEATDIPAAFPLDRAERSVDFSTVKIGGQDYLMPSTGYWFGCFRNSYSCFLNRVDFRDYRRFESDSIVHFEP